MGSWSRRRSFAELALSDSGTESITFREFEIHFVNRNPPWRVADEARPQVGWLWTLLILTWGNRRQRNCVWCCRQLACWDNSSYHRLFAVRHSWRSLEIIMRRRDVQSSDILAVPCLNHSLATKETAVHQCRWGWCTIGETSTLYRT